MAGNNNNENRLTDAHFLVVSGELEMARPADENAAIFHHHPRVEKGEVAIKMFDLSLTTGVRTVDHLAIKS